MTRQTGGPGETWLRIVGGRLGLTTILALIMLLSAQSGRTQTYQSSPVIAGYRGFQYTSGSIPSQPTERTPESKLWYHDNFWWGVLWDPGLSRFRIHRLDPKSQNWTVTGPDVDERPHSGADVLWDGRKLYIATHAKLTHNSNEGAETARVYRFTYDSLNQIYSLDDGFPVSIQGTQRMQALVVAKDSIGKLWLTWTANGKVMINSTVSGNDALWGTAFVLPVQGNDLVTDDISSIVAFSQSQIGVIWSNQNDRKIFFAIHPDDSSELNWQNPEVVLGDSLLPGNIVSNRIDLTCSAGDGTLIAISETAFSDANAPLVYASKRSGGGRTWTNHVVWSRQDNVEGASAVINTDSDSVYIFARGPDAEPARAIWLKSAHLGSPVFQPGPGRLLIQGPFATDVNNPTSTKQGVDAGSGLLVLASDSESRFYLHGWRDLSGNSAPVAVNDSVKTNEGMPVTIDVTANDIDTDGTLDKTSVVLVTDSENGTTLVSVNGEVTYVPDPGFSGRDSLLYTVKDDKGIYAIAAWLVIRINDSPVALGGGVAFNEDTQVTIQIQATDSDGTIDLSTVSVVKEPAHGTAIVAPSKGQITFTPDSNFNGSDGLTYSVKDNDGATSNEASISINVISVNDAPVLDNTAGLIELSRILEDEANNVGDPVSDMIIYGGQRITDVDDGALQGVAITSSNDVNGFWQYSVDSGITWRFFGQVSDNNAVLLNGSARIRFSPAANYFGPAGEITFRAWDQTSGFNGAVNVDVSNNGGSTAFSTTVGQAILNVSSVNDAPILDNTGVMSLTDVLEDNANPSGNTIAEITASAGLNRLIDADPGALSGIALIGADNINGLWQYSLDGALSWDNVGAVSNRSALLLNPEARLRFVPAENYEGVAGNITFRGWDQTIGSNGDRGVDVSVNGGSTAYSTATEIASLLVVGVNDAPQLDNSGEMVLTDVRENDTNPAGNTVADIIFSAGGDRITDIDMGALEGIAVIGADNTRGVWQYSVNGGSSWASLGAVSNTAAVLLNPSARLRFVPATNYDGPSGNISFRAWDQTSGTNGNTNVDASRSGASTAFSSASETASLTVLPGNSAPALDNSGIMTLTGIREDDSNPGGDTVTEIIASAGGDRITDTDSDALEGLAVIGVDNTKGLWQFSLDGGSSWNQFGSVSNKTAVLLEPAARIRFVPNANYNGLSGNFTFRAWDLTTGANGDAGVDVSANGGSTAFSAAIETAAEHIIPVNDAPVLDNTGEMVLSDVDEETTDPVGDSFADIILSAGGDRITDVDAGAVEGAAVIAVDNRNGSWQYSIDGGSNWNSFGVLSNTSAVLISSAARVRFVPNPGYNGSAGNIRFRAWDRTAGQEGGTGVNVSVNGDSSAYSLAIETATLFVNALNDAPVLDNSGDLRLTDIDEDDIAPPGDLISDILASGGGDPITDADSLASEGIAVVAVDNTKGRWEYSLDGGVSWAGFGIVSDASALLLHSAARLRFVPLPNYNGLVNGFTFRAWDRTSGSIGSLFEISRHGGSTAFSVATETMALNITAVNDAPVLDSTGDLFFIDIVENDSNSGGETIADVLIRAGGDRITDVDSGAVEGIAVIGVDNSNGSWQYSLSEQTGWAPFGLLSNTAAALLPTTAKIRFVPHADYTGSAGQLIFRAWDQSTGLVATVVDVSKNGGTTAFSTATGAATLNVVPANSAPVLDNTGQMLLTNIDEDEVDSPGNTVAEVLASAGAGRVSDADPGTSAGLAVISVDNTRGQWQFSIDGGLTWTIFGLVSNARAVLLDPFSRIRFIPHANYNGPAGNLTFRAWDQSSGATGDSVNVTVNGGSTAFSSETETATLSVLPINDAPVLDNLGEMRLTQIFKNTTNPPGNTVADIIASAGGDRITDQDIGALEGIALVAADHSNGVWQYSVLGDTMWVTAGAVSNSTAILLRPVSRIRFVPARDFSGLAGEIVFRAWDQTVGVSGELFDVSVNGGSTAFSSASETANVNVATTNHAPALDNTGEMTLSDIMEGDSNGAGDLVGAIIASASGDRILDPDPAAIEGIAVMRTDTSNGTWQYSINDGAFWLNFGPVSDISAVLLNLAARIRFVPRPGFNGISGDIAFRAWDQTSGVNGETAVDVSINGGTTAFSTNVETAYVKILPVNNAPVLDNTGEMRMMDVTEDERNPEGTTIAALLGSAGGDRITDLDTGALEGIAVVDADNSNGVWQFSSDAGATWNDVGTVSNTAAILLTPEARMRLVPNPDHSGPAGQFIIRAWDQSTGSNGDRDVDVSVNGGASAFSSAVEIVTIFVNPINDAPVLDNSGQLLLRNVVKNEVNPSGDLIADVLTSAGGNPITDVDPDALEGIAVIAVDNTKGDWQFSIDGGASWLDFGAVSNSSSVLLDPASRIRFVPDPDYEGPAGNMAFRAWDQTTGLNGERGVNVTFNGATTAFSLDTETAMLTVVPGNFAPLLDNSGQMTLTEINQNDLNPPGDRVSDIVLSAGGDRITDPDAGALEGIAVVGADNTRGVWQYSVDGGLNWHSFGALSDASATLLDPAARIRFVPNPNYNGSAGSITFRAWDQTIGLNGDTGADATINGGSSAFSGETETATLHVNAPPVVSDDVVVTDEDLEVLIQVTANDNDIDGTIIGATLKLVSQVAHGITEIHADGSVTYIPNKNFFGADSFTYTVDDDDGARSGEATVTIAVNDINDPPIAADDAVSTNEDTPLTFNVLANDTDPDGSIAPGSVSIISSVTQGTLQDHGQGTVTYVPHSNFHGIDSFKYMIRDNKGAVSPEASVLIIVNPVNDAPGAFARLQPTDGNTITTSRVNFIWSGSHDVDGEAVGYVLSVTASQFDTTLTVSDTTVTFDLASFPITQVLTVAWSVTAVDNASSTPATNGVGVFTLDVLTSVNDLANAAVPETFVMYENYPNPFNPSTTIRYGLPEHARVRLEIYNILGQRIRVLISEEKPPGMYTAVWDGRSDRGGEAASGTYVYHFEATGSQAKPFTISKKMMLAR